MLTLLFFYGIIVFVLAVGAFFVVYHLLKYSLNETLGYFGCIVFGTVFCLLLFVNFISLQAVNLPSLTPAFDLGSTTPNALVPVTPSKNNPW